MSLFFHIICEFLLVWFWLWFFNEWFKCAFLFSLWPMTYHLSVLWLAVSAYSALGGTYLIAFQSPLLQLLILLFSSSFLLAFSSFLFFFFNQIRCSILLFHSVSLTVSSVVLWETGMSVSDSHAGVFCKRRKHLHAKQKNKDDFSTLLSLMEEHNKERIISVESKQHVLLCHEVSECFCYLLINDNRLLKDWLHLNYIFIKAVLFPPCFPFKIFSLFKHLAYLTES